MRRRALAALAALSPLLACAEAPGTAPAPVPRAEAARGERSAAEAPAPVPRPQAALPPGEDQLAGCRVLRVVDGDTLRFGCAGGEEMNVRLVGYDTPETTDPGCAEEKALGLDAAIRLSEWLLEAERVQGEVTGRDRYGRPLLRLALDGEDVAERMVAAGLAVPYAGGRRIDWCARIAAAKARATRK
ncbi:hypothetical protein LNKW23_06200 [Paralimibaculum aggregatum]|uniref:TNase-like domain-containing protein n=1 Tax=Paralimibaculum aggregatum TaxID=3036245 RepID=A0ABQ6LDH8_9RHOB|nr:thermonuclease family protein [Limibaculum sp. NKW23]GMG81407.1 hypothetical protein LNKW23_06200 [Limibaculum sp. NKW23]